MSKGTEIKIVEEAQKPLSMNPKKFALWIFMATVVMLFGAWTSAFLVKRGAPGWVEIVIPDLFTVNTIIIVISSLTMVWAVIAARKDKLETVKVALSITAILGVAFMVGQYFATFGQMVELNEHLTGGAVSHSFVYVLSWAHVAHVVSAVIFLVIVLLATFRYKVHSKSMNQLEMCAQYWHFLGVLWLYLFGFLHFYK
ncbi:MAG TPA: cytochrome c oxidase subunit 3 [Ohtaekwangia sp.]